MLFGLQAESREWAGGYGSFRRQAIRLSLAQLEFVAARGNEKPSLATVTL
jgi:hypothetical protein